MKKLAWFTAALVVVGFAAVAYAGHGEKAAGKSASKCTYDASTCLSHLSEKRSSGFLGLKYDANEDGTMAVKEIIAGSPAEQAGFQKGDVLLTLNGASFSDKEALKKAKGDWKPGSKVTYTVKREAAEKEIAVTLGTLSDDAFYTMVGDHMINNHVTVATAAAPEKPN